MSDTSNHTKPIAIVGISTEFPGGPENGNLDHKQFFDFLMNKGQAYEKIPLERFNINTWKGHTPGRVLTDTGCFLKNISFFDHIEFGITATDARSMALSTRKLIEHSFLALLDSGIDYRGRNIGCYMSGVAFDITTIADPDEHDALGSFTGYPSMIANKVSYVLDLLGPSIPTETACSSTLSALHLAVQALRSGDCESAIVGGCQLNVRLLDWIQYSRASILSPDGKCKPFDEGANGFGRGEGVSVIALKPLEDAIRDGDHIYATILGTGINSSGGAAPAGAPVAEAQADAMARAYQGTGRHPSEVDFVELHATGTAAGDPTEANWVGKKFKRQGELLVGSVKGNIGHLEITAFLASLSKVCSIFRTGVVPPNVNFNKPNPAIDWDSSRLRVPTEPTRLCARHPSGRLLVSLTSSGIGGANGHALIEAPPIPLIRQKDDADCSESILFVTGGLSPRSASLNSSDLADLIMKIDKSLLRDLSSVYGRRSRQMTWRSYAVWSPETKKLEYSSPAFSPRTKSPVVFVFSGQGPQYLDMGRQLFKFNKQFRDSVLKMDNHFTKIAGYSLIKHTGLFDEAPALITLDQIWPISITLPALAMLQMALFDLLTSIGVRPDVVLGHSAGETAMMYGCGAMSQEMVLEIAIARGISMTHVQETAKGTMAAINCSVDDAQTIIDTILSEFPGCILDIACYNSTKALTISGDEGLVDKAVELASSKGFFARRLRARVPVHSRSMDICRDDYNARITSIFSKYEGDHKPSLSVYSCVTGVKWDRAFDSDYFWLNAREPVMFSSAIREILKEAPGSTFIELSPHPVLSSYLVELGAVANSVVCPMRRAKETKKFHESAVFLSAVGSVAILGCNTIDYPSLNGCDRVNFDISIPSYRFTPKFVPYLPESSKMVVKQLHDRAGPLNCMDLRLSSTFYPDLAEHIIQGEAIMPAAGFLEMAFEHGARFIWNIRFRAMMPILKDKLVHVNFDKTGVSWSISSMPSDRLNSHNRSSRLHVDGNMSQYTEAGNDLEPLDLHSVEKMYQGILSNDFYATLSYFAQYGPLFRRVTACYVGENEALAVVRCSGSDLDNLAEYIIHPAVLDACFHVLVHPAVTADPDRTAFYLPAGIDAIVLHDPEYVRKNRPEFLYSFVKFNSWYPDHLSFDLTICGDQGVRICSMFDFRIARHSIEAQHTELKSYDMVYLPMTYGQDESNLEVPVLPLGSIMATSLDSFVSVSSSGEDFLVKFEIENSLAFAEVPEIFERSGCSRLWMYAIDGRDAQAARGFFRSWVRETLLSNAHLIIFGDTCSHQKRVNFIRWLSKLPPADLEAEIFIDNDGVLRVPRLVPLTEGQYTSNRRLAYATAKDPSPEDVLVRFSSVSLPQGGLRSFIGLVEDPRSSSLTAGACVVGVAHSACGELDFVHQSHLFVLENEEVKATFAALALPMVFIALAIGSGALINPERLLGRKVFVAEGEEAFTHSLKQLLEACQIFPLSLPENVVSLKAVSQLKEGGIVLGDYEASEHRDFVRSIIPPSSTTFFWNDPSDLAALRVQQTPWVVRDAFIQLQILLRERSLQQSLHLSQSPLVNIGINRYLFDSTKAYVLVGGIGSLGIYFSLWMYENGARYIVLTSRSGKDSLKKTSNVIGLRILSYLESRQELTLKLESCDATSKSAMSALVSGIECPLGGCILMSVILSDQTLASHTNETFYIPFAPKEQAFLVLESVVDIALLDFLITISSASIFGSVGQTNYASANTLVDGMTQRYPNAFSFIAPLIVDSTVAARGNDLSPDPKYKPWLPWAMTSRELCQYLGDGIRRLQEGPIWLYIPDLKWKHVQKQFGPSHLYGHLIEKVDEDHESVEGASEMPLRSIVLRFLDVTEDDFSPEVPFTSYGLDSLSAGQMMHALRAYLEITQLQLLADVSLRDLEKRIESSCSKVDE